MALCDKIKRNGQPCGKHAVKGRSKCASHGGSGGRPPTHGLYALIERPRVKELLDAAAELDDPLDLLPDVNMLRSLTVDFVERYDETMDALRAWHGSYSREYQEELRAYHKRCEGKPKSEWPDEPDPVGYGKPVSVLDISAASSLIDRVGAMVDRIEKRQDKSSVSLELLNDLIEAYTIRTAEAIRETIDDPDLRSKLGRAVDKRCLSIFDDTLGSVRARAARSVRRQAS